MNQNNRSRLISRHLSTDLQNVLILFKKIPSLKTYGMKLEKTDIKYLEQNIPNITFTKQNNGRYILIRTDTKLEITEK